MESLRLTGRAMTPRRTQAHSDRPPAVAQPIRPPTHQSPGQSRGRKHMDSSLSVPKHQSTIVKSHVGPTASRKDSVRLRGSSTQSRDGREEKKKSALTKLVRPTSSTKLQLPRDVASRKQFRDEEGDSQTAISMNHKRQPQRPSMKRAGGTQQWKKAGPGCESQRSVYYSNKKLPPSEFPSPTSSSYTMTESTEESASQSSSPTLPSQRTSKQPWMRRKKSLGKYYSSSSSSYSSSSPRWLVSRPAWSLRRRPRAVREEPAEKRRGRLRRFKDKLAVIFHNHHHHHHHYHRGGDSEVESPTTPSKDDPHLPSAATVVRKGPRRRHHGHGLYTLLQRLLRHVWHSGMEEEKVDDRRDEMGKKGGRLVGAGSNGWWMQGAAAAGAKLGSRKKKPRLGLGFPKTQRSKAQAL